MCVEGSGGGGHARRQHVISREWGERGEKREGGGGGDHSFLVKRQLNLQEWGERGGKREGGGHSLLARRQPICMENRKGERGGRVEIVL